MGNDFTSAQALFAGSNGPVATDFHVFASLYTALFTPSSVVWFSIVPER